LKPVIQSVVAYNKEGAGGSSAWVNWMFNPISPHLRVKQFGLYGNLLSSYAIGLPGVNYGVGAPGEGNFRGPCMLGTQYGLNMGKIFYYVGSVSDNGWQIQIAFPEVDIMGGFPVLVATMLPDWAIDASPGSASIVYEVVNDA
jgi:hypothetical protein